VAARSGGHVGVARACFAVSTAFGVISSGCGPGRTRSAPSITIDHVPRADPGGTPRLSDIAGQAAGAQPGQRVVLYARSGDWYVQPFVDAPFTAIRSDSTWASRTHLGTDYAALLVNADFQPPAIAAALPGPGGGVAAAAVVAGAPPFWLRRSFVLLGLAAAVAGGIALHFVRVRVLTRQLHLRAEERLAERTRIAQSLYDTLLQGLLGASLQLHMALAELPDDSPHRAPFAAALATLGAVAEEGRRVLHGLRGGGDAAEGLDGALLRLRGDAMDEGLDFRVNVLGPERALHPIIRDEVYGVCREAVANVLRHARAKTIRVEIQYGSRALRVAVRDDGCGIGSYRAARASGAGLWRMEARAEAIGARLRVRSRSGGGTEVVLSVPGPVVYAATVGGREMSDP
jgi:signal transduction histidine kinase